MKMFFSRAHPATLNGPVPDLGFADTTLYSIIKLDNIALFAADLFLMQLQKNFLSYCQKLTFEFCNNLSLSFVTISVFKMCHNFSV